SRPAATYELIPCRDVDGVDDADDGGVHRAVLHAGRHAGGAAADDEHRFAHTGVHGIDGHPGAALGLAVRVHRPGDQKLVADEPRVLPRGDDGPDDAGEDHARLE